MEAWQSIAPKQHCIKMRQNPSPEEDHLLSSDKESSNKSEDFSQENLSQWKIKRKTTLMVFIMLQILFAMNYAIILPTLWFYLVQIKASHVNTFYGLIFGVSMISASVASIIFGKVADDTRQIRNIVLTITLLTALGNIIYSVGFSPYLILFGRFISAVGAAFSTVATGELARSYETHEFTGLIAIYNMVGSAGLLIAPGLNVAFKDTKIKLGSWHINNTNAGKLMLAVLFIIMLVSTVVGVHDLTKEYDMKRSREISLAQITNESKTEEEQGSVLKKTIKKIYVMLKRPVLLILFYTSFVNGFSNLSFEILISLLATNILKWKMIFITFPYAMSVTIFMIISLILYCISRNVSDVSMIMTGYGGKIIGVTSLLAFHYCRGIFRSASYWTLVVSFSCSWVLMKTPVRSLTAKCASSFDQSITEATRYTLTCAGYSLGAIFSSIGLFNLIVFGLCVAILNVVGLVFVICWRRELTKYKSWMK